MVGTMIELPRAALIADEIAEGSRVLQLRHQRSHPDHLRLLARRHQQDSCPRTWPRAFSSRIRSRRSIRKASDSWSRWRRRRAAQTRPNLKIGICGEHGGEPSSVEFCAQDRLQLCVLLALPRADRAPGGGAGRRQCRVEDRRRPNKVVALKAHGFSRADEPHE